jgi:hypothetical protein
VNSAAAAAADTRVTANVSCPAGKVLLGGGGRVTTNDTARKVSIQESYPSSTTTWTVVGVVQTTLAFGRTMTVTPYAICSQ